MTDRLTHRTAFYYFFGRILCNLIARGKLKVNMLDVIWRWRDFEAADQNVERRRQYRLRRKKYLDKQGKLK